jgi:hypothetical protein
VDCQEGAKGDILLVVMIDPVYVEKYEWVQKGNAYREYLVPAKLFNCHSIIRRATEEDEQRGKDERQERAITMLRALNQPASKKVMRAHNPKKQ